MSNTRLTVVVRKDLQMSPGLLAAQVCHMADAFMRKLVVANGKADCFAPSKQEAEWCGNPYLSVLGVNCCEDLHEIADHAIREKLPVNKWEDLVPSPTFSDKSIRALVGVAIGPADFDAIKIVTGGLEPY